MIKYSINEDIILQAINEFCELSTNQIQVSADTYLIGIIGRLAFLDFLNSMSIEYIDNGYTIKIFDKIYICKTSGCADIPNKLDLLVNKSRTRDLKYFDANVISLYVNQYDYYSDCLDFDVCNTLFIKGFAPMEKIRNLASNVHYSNYVRFNQNYLIPLDFVNNIRV